MQNNPQRSTTTICVASGKGGVGKTTFSVNLAVALGNLGNKVLLFDGDMGLANAQIALDCILPSVEDAGSGVISSYLSGLEKLLIETRYGITLLPGMNGNHALANMGQEESFTMVRSFAELSGRFDYLIIDSAAGLSESILALLQASDIRLVIGTNEPASITDAYGLLKTLNKLDVLEHLYFIPNKCATPNEGKALFEKMQNVVRHFLGMNIEFLGSVSEDQHVNKSWKKSIPFIAFSPKSQVSLELNRIADRITRIKLMVSRNSHVKFFG